MSRPEGPWQPGLTVVVPCYDEERAVEATITSLIAVLDALADDVDAPLDGEVIAVDDGSRDRTGALLDALDAQHRRLRVIHHPTNRGYGASLKRGIAQARYDRIAITDADGTYPNEQLPALVRSLGDAPGRNGADMVVGARTGANVHVPLVRRPAKWLLLQYARSMSRADIRDVNSGLRALWTRHVSTFWTMLPDTFSFTTTITLAMHASHLDVVYRPIDYHPRVGASAIRPVRDTLRFFSLVLRTTMYFRPLPVFGGIAVLLVLLAIGVGTIGRALTGQVPDVITVSLFQTGLIFFGLGLIGDLINARRGR
ncbi:MAG: glycosyltransferase family 2 protein [Acidobacteriota bacterium]